jgi:hypothetical protein
MRTFAEIHATNPYFHLLDDDCLYDAEGQLIGDFKVQRLVVAWTERTEALETAVQRFANAGEGFKESYAEEYEAMETHLRLHEWAEHSRIEERLKAAWAFRQEWMGIEVDRKYAALYEVTEALKNLEEQRLMEGVR